MLLGTSKKIPITKRKEDKSEKGVKAEEMNIITLLLDMDTENSYLCIGASFHINRRKSFFLKNC